MAAISQDSGINLGKNIDVLDSKPIGLHLKVLEAYTRDAWHGVARIDYATMEGLGLSTGDVFEIKGNGKTTVARCLPLYPSDEGKGIIRIDGTTRTNGNLQIGDVVLIVKIPTPPPAQKILLRSEETTPPISNHYFTQTLETLACKKTDEILVPYFGGSLRYKILDFKPFSEVVQITKKTQFSIHQQKTEQETKNDRIIIRINELIDEQEEKIITIMNQKNPNKPKLEETYELLLTLNQIRSYFTQKNEIL